MDQQPTPAPTPTPKGSLGVPIAIVLAAALIAGAIIFTGMQKTGSVVQNGKDDPAGTVTAEVEIAPVTEKDHIRGNPNAPIMIVEYSDYDCPFCRIFHDTMTKVMNEYGANGKVAWVFRNFPLVQLHPNAPKMAEAGYCVTELGGNDAFWKYTDALNNSRKVEYTADGNIKNVEPTDMNKMTSFAAAAGVDTAKFNECLSSGKYTKAVADDGALALKTGARGTPYSILVVGDQKGIINGAQPYANVKQMIDNLLTQTGEKTGDKTTK